MGSSRSQRKESLSSLNFARHTFEPYQRLRLVSEYATRRYHDMSERQANPYHQIITRPDQYLVELLGKPCDYPMMRITVLTYTII